MMNAQIIVLVLFENEDTGYNQGVLPYVTLYETNVLRHRVDSEAFKEFDKNRTWFAQEPCNIRLRLATDGFNPFGNMSKIYNMWPVI